MNRKLTATTLVIAAVLTNLGFTMLGTIFGYPDVLKEPTADILQRFRYHQNAVTLWFTVLALSAALFAPIAIGVGRLRRDRTMRLATGVGIAAAAVQVIGLARWSVLVPGFAHDATSSDPATVAAAHDRFRIAHVVLGNIIGETFGYILTAAWTLLVVASFGHRFAGRTFVLVGRIAAVMIAIGVLSPLDLTVIDMINFLGYVAWSAWLVWLAASIIRHDNNQVTATVPSVSPTSTPTSTRCCSAPSSRLSPADPGATTSPATSSNRPA